MGSGVARPRAAVGATLMPRTFVSLPRRSAGRKASTQDALRVLSDMARGVLWFADYGQGPQVLLLDGAKREGELLHYCPVRT